MKEEVSSTQYYLIGYRVDENLLSSLENIFVNYRVTISVECSNDTVYSFESITECQNYFSKVQDRIIKLELRAESKENRVMLVFSNKRSAKVYVDYYFEKADEYFFVKNKIENCLKNFRVQYWILSILPITPILSTLIVSMLYIYTGKSHINFRIIVQRIILFVWIADIILFALPQFCKIKRNLFPCVEFRVGQNENIENKYSKMRNFLCVTVFCTVFLGIIVNIISKFIGIG